MSDRDRFYQVGVYTRMHRPGEGPTFNGVCYRTHEHAVASAKDLQSRWTMMCEGDDAYVIRELTPEQVRDMKLTIYDEPTIKGPNHRVQL